MATGTINNIPQLKVVKNAFAFEQTATQTVQLNDYAEWILVDVYTNNNRLSLGSNSLVTDMVWNYSDGILTIIKPAGAWVGENATVVLMKP